MGLNIMTNTKKQSFIILLFMFLMGSGSVISQSIIFREFLIIFYGNELILGVILFFWLFFISIGALTYPLMESLIKDHFRWFINLALVFSLIPSALIPFIRISRSLTGTPYGQFVPFLGMAWIALCVVFPPGFLIGLIFPTGCKALQGETAVSRIYVWEALGSLAGGAILSFILLRFFSPPIIAALLFNLFCWAVVINLILHKHLQGSRRRLVAGIILIIAGISLLFLSPQIDRRTVEARWQTLIQELPLKDSRDTRYQNIALTKQMDQYSIFFNGIYGFSFPDEYEDAVKAHHVMIQNPDPKKVLIIGEVNPGFIEECLKHKVDSLWIVYLDPLLYDIISNYYTSEEKAVMKDYRVNLIAEDGRRFVKTTSEKFDLVFINLPDPSTAFLNRCYTLDFFKEVRNILTSEGTAALSFTSSENFLGAQVLDYNSTIYRTLKEVFPHIAISPGTWTYLFASLDPMACSDDFQVLFQRFEDRNVEDTIFSPYTFEMLYEKNRVEYKREIFEKYLSGRLNTDLSPSAYLYNLKLWDKYSSSSLENVFDFIETKGFSVFLYIMLGLLIIFAVWITVLKPKRELSGRVCNLYSVFSVGLSAMGLSIILFYSFQSLYGYLFEQMGFLVALFMLGIALGGSLVHYLIKQHKNRSYYLPAVQLGIALLCFSLPYLLEGIEGIKGRGVIIFYLLVVFTGFLTGNVFPMSASLLEKWGVKPGTSAALTESMDHLGGCMGALLVGTFLVPLLGFAKCLLILAVLQILALLLWGIRFARSRFVNNSQ